MAMDWSTKQSFDRYMADGDWHMRYGESYERDCYWSDAKDHYYRAANCYQQAYDIARSADDYSQNDAYRKQREAESNFRSISHKAWDHEHNR
ncbi:MAG: hypothetical protein IJ371_05910 [Clostridia bacterium]|nr:hypothetical protein [Clostridia bacterium]